jgi:cell division septal protein FtsQ
MDQYQSRDLKSVFKVVVCLVAVLIVLVIGTPLLAPTYIDSTLAKIYRGGIYQISSQQINTLDATAEARQFILKNIPQDQGYLWWLTHSGEVQSQLMQQPTIKSAQISFNLSLSQPIAIRVEFEAPGYIALQADGKSRWVMSRSGAFLFPAALSGQLSSSLPLVSGVLSPGVSPEQVSARLNAIERFYNKLNDVIIGMSNLSPGIESRLREVLVAKNDTAQLLFSPSQLSVIVDLQKSTPSEVDKAAENLKIVLSDERFDRAMDATKILEIDLTAENVAAITLR